MPIEFANLPKRGFDILRLRDVNTDENCLAASLLDLAGGLVAGLLLKIGNYDDSTLFGNSQRGGLADSRSGACNQDHFAGKLLPMSRSPSANQSGPLGLNLILRFANQTAQPQKLLRSRFMKSWSLTDVLPLITRQIRSSTETPL